MSSRLATTICGMQLKSPVMAASGTFAYGVEMEGLVDWDWIGGIVVKGLSKQPMDGNPGPRLWETESGMMNSVGLQNIGVRAFVREKLPRLRELPVAVFANVFGYAIEDYVEVVRVLEDAPDGVAGYELNVSCPNTRHGGIYFSGDAGLLSELTAAVRAVTRRPVMVKLSPNVARIEPLALAAEAGGADAVSLVNTFVALAVDARGRRPRIAAGMAGLSGPAIKPMALRMVYEAARAVKIPVVGLGGIATGEDAAEYLVAGASAVQVGTASFFDPGAVSRVGKELDRFLRSERIATVGELVGTLKMGESEG